MATSPEQFGGVSAALRDLARRGSFDGAWDERKVQRVVYKRQVALPDFTSGTMEVEFHAARYTPELSRPSRLLTLYSLSAVAKYDELIAEEIPDHIRMAISERRQRAAASSTAVEIDFLGNVDPDEQDVTTETLDKYDDRDDFFRYEHCLSFMYNGRGQLLHELQSDGYYDAFDDEDVLHDATALVYYQGNEASIRHWLNRVEDAPKVLPKGFLEHPDLQKLEYDEGRAQLREDMSYWEIVQHIQHNPELARFSVAERNRDALAMMAFLRLEHGSAGDVLETLYK